MPTSLLAHAREAARNAKACDYCASPERGTLRVFDALGNTRDCSECADAVVRAVADVLLAEPGVSTIEAVRFVQGDTAIIRAAFAAQRKALDK